LLSGFGQFVPEFGMGKLNQFERALGRGHAFEINGSELSGDVMSVDTRGGNWPVQVKESVVGSGFEPGRNERAPCFAGDSLVDHLAVDRAYALYVLGENLAGSLHRLGTRRERRVDRTDLRGVNGGLGGEAKRHSASDLLFQAGLVMQIEEG
jgi:hypothetical protein